MAEMRSQIEQGALVVKLRDGKGMMLDVGECAELTIGSRYEYDDLWHGSTSTRRHHFLGFTIQARTGRDGKFIWVANFDDLFTHVRRDARETERSALDPGQLALQPPRPR